MRLVSSPSYTPVKNLASGLNGIGIAYLMATVNAGLGMLLAFGLSLDAQEQASIVAFMNCALVALSHLSHRLGENEQQLRNDATNGHSGV